MTKEIAEPTNEFLMEIADCTNKIDYVAWQAVATEEDPIKGIEVIKDYNDRIIAIADKFNEWLIEQCRKD